MHHYLVRDKATEINFRQNKSIAKERVKRYLVRGLMELLYTYKQVTSNLTLPIIYQ